MVKRHRSTAAPAIDAVAGALLLCKFMLKLFERGDGQAADWPLIAETLLREAFHALDQVPYDPRSRKILGRVQSGIYDRLTAKPADAFRGGEPSSGAAPVSDYAGPQHHFSDAPKS